MNSNKVYMIIGGKLATVPAEHADKLAKKEMLVARAAVLNDLVRESDNQLVRDTATAELHKLVSKIISLNRRIPACVNFPTEYQAFA